MEKRLSTSSYFGELCELVSSDAPERSHRRTEDISFDCRYWLELYRWIDYEEAYDRSVQEFAPPRVPVFRYDHINQFRNRIKKNLIFKEINGDNIDDILLDLGEKQLRLKDRAQPTCLLAPLIHPEVEAAENSPFKYGERKHPMYPINKKLTSCLAPNAQSAIFLTGHAPRLGDPVFIFARLKNNVPPAGVVEVPFPIKYVVISLSPNLTESKACIEDGRIFGTFMMRKRFREDLDRASSPADILAAVDKYLGRLDVEAYDPKKRRNRNDSEMSYLSELFEAKTGPQKRKRDEEEDKRREGDQNEELESKSSSDQLNIDIEGSQKRNYGTRLRKRLCPPGRDFVLGCKAMAKRYVSDFTDAFSRANFSVCISSIPFIFFVVFAPAITMGTLMQRQVNSEFSVSNSILASGLTTFLYAAFAGQPIAIIGPSGPGFLMERLIAMEAQDLEINFWMFRFWTLLYTAMFGIVLTGLNLSNLSKHARRSVEELFSAFVSGFLIIKALFSIFRGIPQSLPPKSVSIDANQNDKLRTAAIKGTNAFIALLMTCTCLVVVKFKTSQLTRRKIRFWIGALNVPIGICLMIAVERIFFAAYEVDLLQVLPVAQINYTTWFNTPVWSKLTDFAPSSASTVHGMALLYGFLLAFMIFVEIGLNSVVALRFSVKPSPASIDHLLTNVVFPIVSMFLGLPIVSGVPVRTIANMMALVKVNPNPAPGDEGAPWYLVEQRVNTMAVGILVTLSVYLGDFLCHIPVASLFGLFIYLGIFGLRGSRYKQIVVALFSRKKYWSQWNILDGIPRRFVCFFIAIWSTELIIMVILLVLGEWEEFSAAGAAIPFVLVLSSVLREVILPKCTHMAPYLDKMDPLCAIQVPKKKEEDDDDEEKLEGEDEEKTV
ncbi:hypothetical protein Aperf_G00000068709 [Anoplocephala perfoliata]